MEAASPARLYATLVGAVLAVLGIVGFFYSASFGAPGDVDEALGSFEVNAWLNLLHAATGVLGLVFAGVAPRRCALALGVFYLALAIWGFSIDEAGSILGFLPAGDGNDFLHLAIGVLGLAAAAGTPRSRPKRRAGLEARAKPAAERP